MIYKRITQQYYTTMIKELNKYVSEQIVEAKRLQHESELLSDKIFQGGRKTALHQILHVNRTAKKDPTQLSAWLNNRMAIKRNDMLTDNLNLEIASKGQISVFKDVLEKFGILVPHDVQNALKTAKNGLRGYITLEQHPIEYFFDVCDALKRVSMRKRWWLSLLARGGDKLVCPISGLKVSKLCLDVKYYKNGKCSYHWNFYSECDRMFTVDHIQPRSKGGDVMNVENLQSMIGEYNELKGNREISYEQLKQELHG